ncbi:MAG: hypothetical protein DWQ34_20980 [Planctomycetota bacterium]|nr:MAG: hypothetical protein DWQ34_20980 [Planctomycetota bacterium]REK21629.1 MAG: hypothetical protein DWQ41_20800 [Planctomycetota bacterium]REK29978.1 MAG: hypothetical protein DWQ45_22135 [Planctomycetota bacterium]
MTNEPSYVEGDATEPLTRGEFNDAMQSVGRSFESVVSDVNDVKSELGELRQHVDDRFDQVMQHFDAVTTRMQDDIVSSMKQVLSDHEQRIRNLER